MPRLADEMLNSRRAVQKGDHGSGLFDPGRFENAASRCVTEDNSMSLAPSEPQSFHVSFDGQIGHSVRLQDGGNEAADRAAPRQDDMVPKVVP